MDAVGLHNHTSASDGFFSPQRLMAEGLVQGYESLAITDHNTIHGWLPLTLPAHIIPGIELSGFCPRTQTEVHLLGYGIQATPALLDFSEQFYAFYGKVWETTLATLGAVQTSADLQDRSQALEELIAEGTSPREVMAVWSQVQGALKQQGLAPGFPEVLAAVDFLHEAGAQVSIAHPQRYPQAVSEELLARVDAVEVYHPSHSPSITDFWRSVAVRTGKQVTGGHDFHGWTKPHTLPAPLKLTDELLLST